MRQATTLIQDNLPGQWEWVGTLGVWPTVVGGCYVEGWEPEWGLHSASPFPPDGLAEMHSLENLIII